QDSTISGNSALGNSNTSFLSGGAAEIRLNDSSLDVKHCCIINQNSADRGLGGGLDVHAFDSSSATIQDSTISGNTGSGGGALAVYAGRTSTVRNGSYIKLKDSTISGNNSLADGGGVYANLSFSQFTIQGVTISGNTTVGRGGGLYLRSHDSQILMQK